MKKCILHYVAHYLFEAIYIAMCPSSNTSKWIPAFFVRITHVFYIFMKFRKTIFEYFLTSTLCFRKHAFSGAADTQSM